MTHTKLNRLAIGIGLAGVAALLAGCSSIAPISARLIDGHVTFVLCSDVKVSKVSVTRESDSGDTETLWKSSGRALPLESEITYGELPTGWAQSKDSEGIDPMTDQLDVTLAGAGDTATDKSTFKAGFGATTITSASWTRADGSVSPKRCPTG